MDDSMSLQELQTVIAKFNYDFSDTATLQFLAKVRAAGILSDAEWKQVLDYLASAVSHQKDVETRYRNDPEVVYADPLNADWIKVVHAWRLIGYCTPRWATLWLWWISGANDDREYWKPIGAVAKEMNFPPFDKSP